MTDGTGAAPLAFSDHVAFPFKVGFGRVFGIFAEAGLKDDVVFVGDTPHDRACAAAVGCRFALAGWNPRARPAPGDVVLSMPTSVSITTPPARQSLSNQTTSMSGSSGSG